MGKVATSQNLDAESEDLFYLGSFSSLHASLQRDAEMRARESRTKNVQNIAAMDTMNATINALEQEICAMQQYALEFADRVSRANDMENDAVKVSIHEVVKYNLGT